MNTILIIFGLAFGFWLVFKLLNFEGKDVFNENKAEEEKEQHRRSFFHFYIKKEKILKEKLKNKVLLNEYFQNLCLLMMKL